MSDEDRPTPSLSPRARTSRLIAGKYRLGRIIGEGGMGAVYEARHVGLNSPVAIKLLNEVFAHDKNAVSRFRREARAAAAIKHPNVVSVTDTGTDEAGVPFLVMELLRGESLSSLLRRHRTLSPNAAASIAMQILAGLAAAHRQGVIHRDLKPGNVLVEEVADGQFATKILDFGVSKFFSDHSQLVTVTGAVVGTPRFMSPEQARGEAEIDGRADLYAVGILLYRMVVGQLPFLAKTQEELFNEILNRDPPRPRDVNPSVPAKLEQIIVKAMTRPREQRYATAEEFLVALQHACPDALTPSMLEQPTRSETLPRRTRPRPKRLWLSAVLIALIGVGMGIGLRMLQRRPTVGTVAQPPLTFAVARYLPRQALRDDYAPLIRYLSDQLNRPVKLEIVDDYIDLGARMAKGEISFASLSPCDYIRAHQAHPELRLVATHQTKGSKTYQGHIVTRANSGLVTLDDLRGKVFCYTNPKSCSGYLYPRATFRKAGIDPDSAFKSERFTGGHLRSLRYLLAGSCDGAAVFAGILYESNRLGVERQQFHVAASTARIPYDAYCASPKIDSALVARFRQALLALKPSSALAKKALADHRIDGFVPVTDADYEPARQVARFLDSKPRKPQR